jgi:hypothetical protein
MICRISLALTFALLLISSAWAQDAKPTGPGLTIRQAIEINAALGQMNCETKLLHDGAKETSACIPYPPDKLKAGLAWAIAKNQRRVTIVLQDYQREVNRFLTTLRHKQNGDLVDEDNVAFQNYQAELLSKPAFTGEPPLDHFKKAEIEPLNLQPSIIAALLPIIDE